LNGLTLRLPPLRERSDLGPLLERELQALVPERSVSVAPDLMQALQHYRWPGNVRQLFNALRTACALLDDDEAVIRWEHLPDDLLQALQPGNASVSATAAPAGDGDDTMADLRAMSRQTIERMVLRCEGNLSEAARLLGISRNTLYRKRRATLEA
jgi:transcriptional regulator of acetoin/glycerol metabolism